MEAWRGVSNQPLPGSDALKSAPLFTPTQLPLDQLAWYSEPGQHRRSLLNASYDHYMQLDKSFVSQNRVGELDGVRAGLEKEDLPVYLEAAGWAAIEAAIVDQSRSTLERVQLVSDAEVFWRKQLLNGQGIGRGLGEQYMYEENEGHRTALNLAFTPLIKSILVGNVREPLLADVLKDVAEIAHDSYRSLVAAEMREDDRTARYHRGFMFEANALMALLYIGDPRYVPIPSTSRGGSGYYNTRQTHDILIIQQHWGELRKLIPIEIKSMTSKRARKRYRALIVSGRIRLASGETTESYETAEAFHAIAYKTATTEQLAAVERLSTELRDMLRLYQQGPTAEGVAVGGLMRYYDAKVAARTYPELSKEFRWNP